MGKTLYVESIINFLLLSMQNTSRRLHLIFHQNLDFWSPCYPILSDKTLLHISESNNDETDPRDKYLQLLSVPYEDKAFIKDIQEHQLSIKRKVCLERSNTHLQHNAEKSPASQHMTRYTNSNLEHPRSNNYVIVTINKARDTHIHRKIPFLTSQNYRYELLN